MTRVTPAIIRERWSTTGSAARLAIALYEAGKALTPNQIKARTGMAKETVRYAYVRLMRDPQRVRTDGERYELTPWGREEIYRIAVLG